MKISQKGQELEPNSKLFPDHLPFIFHGVLVGAWFTMPLTLWCKLRFLFMHGQSEPTATSNTRRAG
jgi:hypothetical protein